MIASIRRSVLVLASLVLLGGSVVGSRAAAQDTTAVVKQHKGPQVEYFYIHGSAGISLDVYSSSDIEDMVAEEYNMSKLGFPLSYGFRTGYRNIAQFELSRSSTTSHGLGIGGFSGGEVVTLASVTMTLKETDFLFKVNPAIWSWKKPTERKPASCLFFIVGHCDATYRDKVNDGFRGSGLVYGMEWAVLSKYGSFSFGATHSSIKYSTTRLFGIDFPYDVKASRFMMYMRLGLGFGK